MIKYSETGVWSVVVSFNSAQTNWPFMSAVTSNHHTMTAPLRGVGTSALIVHTPSSPAGPSAVCTYGRRTRWTQAYMHAPPAPTRRCPGQALLWWTTFSLPHFHASTRTFSARSFGVIFKSFVWEEKSTFCF